MVSSKIVSWFARKEHWLFTILGIVYLLFFLAGVLVNLENKTLAFLIWFCNHAALVLGLALLFRSRFWLTAELSIGLLPKFLWMLDFITYKLGTPLFGFTSYMFAPDYPAGLYWLGFSHFIILPVAVIAWWKLGGSPRKAWLGSIAHGAALFVLSLLASPGLNLNCIRKGCIDWLSFGNWHTYLWPSAFFLLAICTYQVLRVIHPYEKVNNKKIK